MDPGKPRETHTFMMGPPGATTGGLVKGEKGRPIAGATVRILGASDGGAEANDFAHFDLKVKTDAQGRWTCAGLPKTWTWINVSASHPDYVGTLVAGNFQKTTDEQLRGRTAVTELTEGIAIHGQVLNEQGKPLAGARVGLGADRRIAQRFHPSTTTDTNGRFEFGRVVPLGLQVVTAQAADHAPDVKQVSVSGPGPIDVEFRLGPPRSFRGRLVDSKGKPMPGAIVQAFNWRGHSSIDWQTQTDQEGRFAWRSAPPDVVSYNILKLGFMPIRQRWYQASEREHVITLNRPLRIRGSVVDRVSGKPIDEFTVMPATVWIMDFTAGNALFKKNHEEAKRRAMANPPWRHADAKAFRNGHYELEFPEPRDAYFLRVEAPGYQPAVSRAFEASEGEKICDFKISQGTSLSGKSSATWPCTRLRSDGRRGDIVAAGFCP